MDIVGARNSSDCGTRERQQGPGATEKSGLESIRVSVQRMAHGHGGGGVIVARARVLRLWFLLIASAMASIEGACRSAAAIDSQDVTRRSASPPSPTESLPQPGTVTASLPSGNGMDAVRSRCVACHEPAMLRQQRLTAQQWVAEIEKMQGWGAQVSTEDKTQMASYLATIAGRDNTRFSPPIVAPVSAEQSTRNVTGER